MADDGGGGKPLRDWTKWPKIHVVADLEEVKRTVLEVSRAPKRRKPPVAGGKFRFHAKLEDVLGKVLDGKEPPREPPGPKLPPRFVLINELGRGAQSSVYAVFDRELNCKAALKFFKGGGEGRGVREAHALSGVEHPNVVRVQDVQQTDEGRLFIRMEFIDGPTLRKWVEGRKWREVLGAYVQAGRGLAAAHKAGLVHRDFKPENALVRDEDQRVVVVDFGLARGRLEKPEVPAGDPGTSTTSQSFPLLDTTSGLMGTLGYMAPEQFTGKQASVDERTDQFNFCVALYEALDGERPFAGKTVPELMDAVTRGKIKGPPRNAPPWVWRVIRRGLAVDPAQRYPSMNALLAALENDPRKWFMRAGVFALGLALAGGVWQAFEARGERAAMAEAQRDEEKEARLQQERELRERNDTVTLRECMSEREGDPTKAIARLGQLSIDSEFWHDPKLRMLAADIDHRVVARTVVDLGPDEEPYGLSLDGTMAVSRQPTSGEVTLHDLGKRTRRRLDVADTGLPVVEFSADGRFIATQRVPKGVDRWDVASAKKTFLGESPDEHHRMAFVGEATIVTFGRHADVILWGAGGKRVLGGHVEQVDAVAFDPAERFAATVDGARQLRLWELGAMKASVVPEAIKPIAFASTGVLAVTASAACSELVEESVTEVRIIDPRTGGVLENLCTDNPEPAASIAFSPNGKRVAVALPGRALVWELGTGERIDLERLDEEAAELRFATDDMLGSRSADTTLVLWKLPSERPYVLRGHVGVKHWAHRKADGTIVTYGQEGTIRVWTLPRRFDRPLSSHAEAVTHVAWAPSDLVTASRDGSVRAWPLDGGAERVLDAGAAEIGALAVAPDGKRIAFVRGRGEVVVAGLAGGAKTFVEREQVFALAWDRNGQRLAIADKDGGLDVVDAATGRVLTSVREPDRFKVKGLRFRAGGNEITTVGWLGEDNALSIRVFDAKTGARRLDSPLEAKAGDVSGAEAVAFDDQDRNIAITTFQRSVVLWNAKTGMRVLGKHDRMVPGVDFSPDGTQLVTVDEDGVAKLWDVESGFGRTIRFRQALRAVAFAPDGETFAAVGDARVAFFGRDDLPRDAAELQAWTADATNMKVGTTDLVWVTQ